MGTTLDHDTFSRILGGDDEAAIGLTDFQFELIRSARRRLSQVFSALDGSSNELMQRCAEHEANALGYTRSAVNGADEITLAHLSDLAALKDNEAIAVFMTVTADAAKGIGIDTPQMPTVREVSDELIRRFSDVEDIEEIVHGCAYLTLTALAQDNPGPYEMTIQSRVEKRLIGLLS